MNFLFFAILAVPLVAIFFSMIGYRRINMVTWISVGISLVVVYFVFMTVTDSMMQTPELKNDPILSVLFGTNYTPPTTIVQQPLQQPIPNDTPKNDSNESVYLNPTQFNNDYNKWKNG